MNRRALIDIITYVTMKGTGTRFQYSVPDAELLVWLSHWLSVISLQPSVRSTLVRR